MKNRKGIIYGIVAILVVVVGVLGYKKHTSKQTDTGTIKIGAILPLTGKFADVGNSIKAGLEITIEELSNSENSYKIIYYDNKSEVKNSITGYFKLNSDNDVTVFFTTLTDHSLALKPLAIKDKKLLFSVSSSPEIIKDNKNLVFRPSNSNQEEVEFMVDYFNKNQKNKKVVVYSQNTEAGNTFQQLFKEKYGNNVLKWISYDDNISNLKNSTVFSEIDKASSIVIFGYSSSMGNLIRLLRERGYKGDIICNAGFNNPSVIETTGEAAIGTKYLDYDFPYNSETHNKRNDTAIKKYNASFNLVSYCAMGAFKILDKLMTLNNNPIEIGKRLSEPKQYKLEDIAFTTTKKGIIKPDFKLITYKGKTK